MSTRERQRLSDQAATEEMNRSDVIPIRTYHALVLAVYSEIDRLSQPNGMHTYVDGYHAKGCMACAMRDRLRDALKDAQ